MIKKVSVLTAALCLLTQVSYGASLTVYNDNLALVRDSKNINLKKEVQKIEIDEVSANIKPESVMAKFATDSDKIKITEQNFDYDLVNTNKIMNQYIGKDIAITKFSSGKKETLKGKLLAVNGGTVVQTSNGEIVINPEGEVSLPKLPEGVRLKPTLSWVVSSEVEGEKKLDYSYQTTGLSWNADYNITLGQNDDKIDLNGWVTVNNYSGATYNDASLKLIAGDVKVVKPVLARGMKLMAANAVATYDSAVAESGFEERSLFEYYIYDLKNKTTIKDNEKKQIQLISATDIKAEKKYIYEYAVNPDKISVVLSFKNNKESNLGIALPKGTVKVYKEDKDALEFVGENKIDHTPENKAVELNIGNPFDVTAKRTQTEYIKTSSNSYQETISIELKNSKAKDVVVEVKEKLSRSNWRVANITDKYEKVDSKTILFKVKVPAKGSYKLNYTVKYSA